MKPATAIRFCVRHQWQHLDGNGRCGWCDMTAAQRAKLETAGKPR